MAKFKKIIIGLIILLVALALILVAVTSTFVVKYGTPAEHGSSYEAE